MLNFCSLYSGSSGNCLFVENNSTKILVDCGVSGKKVCEGLESIDKKIEDIDAIIVTHEHSDHVQSLGLISKKYAFSALPRKSSIAMPLNLISSSRETAYFKRFLLNIVRTKHVGPPSNGYSLKLS